MLGWLPLRSATLRQLQPPRAWPVLAHCYTRDRWLASSDALAKHYLTGYMF